MKKEKTKENPKIIFEDGCMTVFEDNGRRKVVFANEMRTKVDVEISAKTEGNPIFKFHTEDNSPIFVGSYDPLYIESAPSIIVDEATSLTVKEVKDIRVENFHGSLDAASLELNSSVLLCAQKSRVSIPHSSSGLYVNLNEDEDKSRAGSFQTYLSFGKSTKVNYSCNVRSNLELWVSETPKMVLIDGFHGQSIVAGKAEGKTKGSFKYISGPFGQITEKIEDNHSVYQISKSTDLEIYSPGLLELYTNEINFSYSSQSVALKCKKQIPFNFNQTGDELAFNVDKSNGFMVKSYKNQLKEFSCSYEPDRGALILATPLLALDSYLYSKSTDFSLRDVTEQKLNFVLRSSRNEINLKSDNGAEKNRFHINLDGFMPMLTVRGDKVTSSNVNMNIRGRDNYVEATVVSEDQNEVSMVTVDQLRGKSSMSNT